MMLSFPLGASGGDATPLWPQTWAGAGNSLFAAPQGDYNVWLQGLEAWRTSTRAAAGLSGPGEAFEVESLRWTQTSSACAAPRLE